VLADEDVRQPQWMPDQVRHDRKLWPDKPTAYK